jgi:meso-butanediol dehydrogenase / (S,S)-butanediol dehydrogenase / diacetyl reductase
LVVDVRDNAQQADAVRRHIKRFGSLDVAVLNAGVGESANFYRFKDAASWERCLDINLRAVIVGVEECGRAMAAAGTQGTIVSVASAASAHPPTRRYPGHPRTAPLPYQVPSTTPGLQS